MGWYAKLINDMNNHAFRDYPREACGVIKYENIWGVFHSHPGSDKPIPSQDDKVSAAFQQYKFLVGFNNKFYIYWMDKKIDALKFTKLREDHFK